MIIELSKKVKDVTGAISGTVAILGLVWAGWITFSGFIDEKININIEKKLENPEFMQKVYVKLDSVEAKIEGLYKVDSGYSSILSFDFKSLRAKRTKVKFYADANTQKVILSVYPIGNSVADDDFSIHIDNESQKLNLWGQISGKDITSFLSKTGSQSNNMHTIQFLPNTLKYTNSDKEKIIKTLEIFVLVKNIKR